MKTSKTAQRFLILAAPAALACAASRPTLAEPSRPAADVACPWGRLADGQGNLVRCLTQTENWQILGGGSSAVPGGGSSPPPLAPLGPPRALPRAGASGAEPVDADRSATAPAASAASAAPAPVPATASSAAPAAGAPAPAPAVDLEFGAVVADVGTLPDAVKNLKKARDRFLECAARPGVMTADHADIEVRFLVQSRGRAEGVSVKKVRGLSEAGGKCIAEVVDRRYVGYPEEPVVGATLALSFKKRK